MIDNAFFIDTESMRYSANIEIDSNALESWQHHLEDEGLINGNFGASEITSAFELVIRIDLPK